MNAQYPTGLPSTLPPILEQVRAALVGQEVYLVGGAVRDLLLGRPIHDFDFALPAGGIRTARRLADALHAAFYPLDDLRDTGRVLVPAGDSSPICLDFATYRLPDPAAKPTLEADLRGRDFTINAIALDLHSFALIDPLGGVRHLHDRELRLCSPSALVDDPVRLLRAARLAVDLECRISAALFAEMKRCVPSLAGVSAERLRDELFRVLEGPSPAACLRLLDRTGALTQILPELEQLKGLSQSPPHVHEGWRHTLSAVDHLERILAVLQPQYDPDRAADLLNGMLVMHLGRYRQSFVPLLGNSLNPLRSGRGLLFLAVLYHDVGKPQKRTIESSGRIRFLEHDRLGAELAVRRARALALSNSEITHLELVVRNHMRILSLSARLLQQGREPTRRAIYRFFRDTGEAGVDICLLALADMRATFEQTLTQENWAVTLGIVRTLLENWFEKPHETVRPHPLLNGNDLIRELGLAPGPQIGELLECLRERQAIGELTTRQQALDFARSRITADK